MTPRSIALVGVTLLTIGACAEKKNVQRPTAPPARVAVPAPSVESKPTAAVADGWTYTSAGKRDPFRSFVADIAATGSQPAETRCTTPLGKFDIDQLRLVAVVTGLDDPVAMVEGPNGVGYTLHRGACIGRNGGVVSAVRTGEVVVAEWVVRPDGTRERTQTLLKLPKQPSLEIEE